VTAGNGSPNRSTALRPLLTFNPIDTSFRGVHTIFCVASVTSITDAVPSDKPNGVNAYSLGGINVQAKGAGWIVLVKHPSMEVFRAPGLGRTGRLVP